MDRIDDYILKYLHEICREIGARPTGSNNNRRCSAYLAERFFELGFAVEREAFPCLDWHKGETRLFVGGEYIESNMSDYTLPCNVKAPLIAAGSIEELKESHLVGKILLLHGSLAAESIMPKNFRFWNPEFHRELISILEEKNPLAIITSSFNSEKMIPVIEDGDFNIPCVVVTGNTGDYLRTKINSEVSLKIIAQREIGQGENIIARRGNGKMCIAITAHLDTKPGTPGALDNASGLAILLETARLIKNKSFPFEVEFIAFNGEDYFSNPGEVAFLDSGVDMSRFQLAINVDGVGLKGSNTLLSIYEEANKFRPIIASIAAKHHEIVKGDPWPQGDHMLFVMNNVPTITLTSAGIFSLLGQLIHTTDDNLTVIDSAKIASTVLFIVELLESLGSIRE